ncbi:MAG: DUF2953 domain-containing protein [Oscillospiraceae bacterium]
MVGAIIGWFFLGLLLLFVLLFVLPVTVSVRFGGGDFVVKLRVFFVWITVFPMRPRKPKKAAKKPKKQKAEDDEDEENTGKEKKKRTLSQTVALVKRLVNAGLAALKAFFRHLRIRQVQIVLPVHAEDAGDTAIRCGQMQMAIGAARGVLNNWLNLRFKRIEIIPDFAGQRKDELFLAGKLVFSPGIIFVMGFVFLKSFLASRPRRALRKMAKARRRAMAKAAAATGK